MNAFVLKKNLNTIIQQQNKLKIKIEKKNSSKEKLFTGPIQPK